MKTIKGERRIMNYLETEEWKEFLEFVNQNAVKWEIQNIILTAYKEALGLEQIKEKEK